jgi:phosphotransferase system HPr-like phosphotransfer protein
MNFVTVCNKFDDSIDIKDNKTLIDAKSVMGMLILKLDIPYEIVYECFDDEDNYEEFLSAVVDRYSIDLT